MSLRLIKTVESAQCSREARIYRDAPWDEYVVKFRQDGKPMPDADYHTDDKQDAKDTATSWVERGCA